MENIGTRIRMVRRGISRKDFAETFGISDKTLQRYEEGVRLPPDSFIDQLADSFGVSASWLVTGDGPMAGDAQDQKTEVGPNIILADNPELLMVPMVEAKLSAGHGSFETSAESERTYAFRYDFLRRKGNPKEMVMMRVSGDSMFPAFVDNDVVLIDQSQRQPLPGRVYAVGVEDMVYLKRVDAKPGKLTLYSDNAAYEPLEIVTGEQCEDNVRIIGRAIWAGREL